jgi:hypothetical protein
MKVWSCPVWRKELRRIYSCHRQGTRLQHGDGPLELLDLLSV